MTEFKIPKLTRDAKTIVEALNIPKERVEELKELSSTALTESLKDLRFQTVDIIECFVQFAKTPSELIYQTYCSSRMVDAVNRVDESNPLLHLMLQAAELKDKLLKDVSIPGENPKE